MATQTQTKTAQVTCINKPHRDSIIEAITHIGGAGWRLTAAEAIAAIESRQWAFFTMVNGKRAVVDVRTSVNGRKFLQTHADKQWNNNLLSLAECK